MPIRPTWSTGFALMKPPASMCLKTGGISEMQCYPHLFECDQKIYLLYNGNEFGRHGFGLAVLV